MSKSPKTNPTPLIIDELPYRLCVGIALLNQAGHVFVGHRINSTEDVHWQMPQGGIDEGESPIEAALRELEEETGARQAEILRESADWYSYDIPMEILRRSTRTRYRGQKQKWFAMRHLGGNADINIATAHPEFDDWKWVPLPQVVELIVPFKRGVYERVVEEFLPLTESA